jgi:hypothetical protein
VGGIVDALDAPPFAVVTAGTAGREVGTEAATEGCGMVTTGAGNRDTGRLLPLAAASASAKPAQSSSTLTQSQRSSSENDSGSYMEEKKNKAKKWW